MLISLTNLSEGGVRCRRYMRQQGLVHEWDMGKDDLRHLKHILIAIFYD